MDLISDSSSSFVGFYQVLIGLTGFIFVQLTWASYFRRKWSAWAWRSAERERHIFVQAHASTIVIIIKRRHRKKRWNEKQSWAIRCRGYINLRPSHDVIIDCFFFSPSKNTSKSENSRPYQSWSGLFGRRYFCLGTCLFYHNGFSCYSLVRWISTGV